MYAGAHVCSGINVCICGGWGAGVHALCICMHAKARGMTIGFYLRCSSFYFILFYLIIFWQCLPVNPELPPRDPPSSVSPALGQQVHTTSSFTCGCRAPSLGPRSYMAWSAPCEASLVPLAPQFLTSPHLICPSPHACSLRWASSFSPF